jgi:redox-sensitive bicupin YhaK (pirin superfamily)
MSWEFRKSDERGHFDHGWLRTWHSFSFSQYFNPRWMQFGYLRVLNEDIVAPGEGFDPHSHENMEIVTIVIEGALKHQDSMGNASVIRAGDVQRMSAGTGVIHSEFNHSKEKPVHLFQIWILPDQEGLLPSYEQKEGVLDLGHNRLQLLVSSKRDEGAAVQVNQEVRIFYSKLDSQKELKVSLENSKRYWVQLIRGALQVEGQLMQSGDALFCNRPIGESALICAKNDAEFFWFEITAREV